MHHCELCGVSVGDEGAFQLHVRGKRHRRRQRVVEEDAERLRSVNVYPVRTATDVDSACVYANSFGAVSKSSQITDSTLRVTFAHEDSARRISAKKQHLIDGRWYAVYAVQQSERPAVNQNAGGCDLQPDEAVAAEGDLARAMHAASSLDEQINLLVEKTALSMPDVAIRQAICCEIQRLLRSQTPFKDCTVHLFGSSISGLGTKRCDMDLVLLADGLSLECERPSRLSTQRPAAAVSTTVVDSRTVASCGADGGADVLKTHVRRALVSSCGRTALCITNVIAIPTARVPIVKFHVQSLKADISVNRRLGVFNSRLLRYMCSCDSRFGFVAGAVRSWGRKHRLSGHGGDSISSYSLTLLVVFYLQCCSPPVLPAVLAIKTGACVSVHGGDGGLHSTSNCWDLEPDDGVRCFDASDCERWQPSVLNADGAGQLLRGFFAFYRDYCFPQSVVSTRCGRSLELDALPTDSCRRFAVSPVMNVQDPFDELHNTTANVSAGRLSLFVTEVQRASRCLHADSGSSFETPSRSLSGDPWGLGALLCAAERWSKTLTFSPRMLPPAAARPVDAAESAIAFTNFFLLCLRDLLWFDIRVFDAPSRPDVADTVLTYLASSGSRRTALHDNRTPASRKSHAAYAGELSSATGDTSATLSVPSGASVASERVPAVHAEPASVPAPQSPKKGESDLPARYAGRSGNVGCAGLACVAQPSVPGADSTSAVVIVDAEPDDFRATAAAATAAGLTRTQSRKRTMCDDDVTAAAPPIVAIKQPRAQEPEMKAQPSHGSDCTSTARIPSSTDVLSVESAVTVVASSATAVADRSTAVEAALVAPDNDDRGSGGGGGMAGAECAERCVFLLCDCTALHNAFDGRRQAQRRVFPNRGSVAAELSLDDCRRLSEVMVAGEQAAPELRPVVRFRLTGVCGGGPGSATGDVRFELTRLEGSAVSQFVTFIEKFLLNMLDKFFTPSQR